MGIFDSLFKVKTKNNIVTVKKSGNTQKPVQSDSDDDFLQWLTSHGVKLTEEDKKAMGLDEKSIKESRRLEEELRIQDALTDDVLEAMQLEKDGNIDNHSALRKLC